MRNTTKNIFTLLALLACVSVPAFAQNDSPCAQGYETGDPRHPDVICLPELGRMMGIFTACKPERTESFGGNLTALPDVNHDGLADWSVEHALCDTTIASREPNELLLYKGVRGGLPAAASGERIGPAEIGSQTTLLAAGDWDSDGNIDLAVRIQLLGDTSDSNVDANYDIATCVVFWGNATGTYSLQDTSHLSCGKRMWGGPTDGLSADFDGDGHADLFVSTGGFGFTSGKPVPIPELMIFKGTTGHRWGRDGWTNTASWVMWNRPPLTHLGLVDQNGDGITDIILYSMAGGGGTTHISVLYGNSRGFPDTTDVETVDLVQANGHSSLFADVTGDGIPELLVHAGSQEQIKVYIGLKGQRLKEQYGSGDDSEHLGKPQWWGRPWARIWLPHRVSSKWLESYWTSLAGISGTIDIDGDGIGDILVDVPPFIVCYRGGRSMDSLVDAMVDTRPGGSGGAKLLGDIDGSGVPTICIGGTIFVKPSRDVPATATLLRDLPPNTGPAAVPVPAAPQSSLAVKAIPNPSHGEVRITWSGAPSASGMLVITGIAGRTILRTTIEHGQSYLWNTRGIAPGPYFVTVTFNNYSGTTGLVIE